MDSVGKNEEQNEDLFWRGRNPISLLEKPVVPVHTTSKLRVKQVRTVCSSNWPLCQSVLCHTSILSLILLDSSTIFDTKSWDAGFFFFWPLVFLLRASHSVLHARHGQYVRGEDDLNSSPLLLLSFSLKDGLQLASGTCLFHTVNDHQQDYFSQNLKFPVTLKFPWDLL